MSAASRMKASRHVRMYHMNIKHNKTLYGKILYTLKNIQLYTFIMDYAADEFAQPCTKPLVCTDKKYFRIFFLLSENHCVLTSIMHNFCKETDFE